MAIITVMLAVIFGLVIHFTRSSLNRADQQMLQDIAADPLYLARPGDTSRIRLPYLTVRLDGQNRPTEVAGSYSRLSSQKDYLQNLIRLSLDTQQRTGLLPDYNLRFLLFSTPSDHFLIFMDISTQLATMNHLTRNCLLIGIFSFFVFLGISIFFADWAVRPVERAWNQQKQFLADASHELKTPLTVILTNTELLRSPSLSVKKKTHFLTGIRTMAGQMQKLVEEMLELSRIDSGSIQLSMEPLDFSALTEECLCPFEALYFESGRELTSEISPGIRLSGSSAYLRQLLEILLDNALKYSSASSSVSVSLRKVRHSCLLQVTSHGETLSDEELKRIFQRFYRTDNSRNRDGSYGLGLSIARNIVRKHHGKIWAESQDGVNTFFVQLNCLCAHSSRGSWRRRSGRSL